MGRSGVGHQQFMSRSSLPAQWYSCLAALQQAVEEARRRRKDMPPEIAASNDALDLAAFADAAEAWLEAAPDYPAR